MNSGAKNYGARDGVDLATARQLRCNERKLMEETAEAEILEDALARSTALTTSMIDTLEAFDARLLNFESNILPIQRSTQRLKRFYDNAERTMIATKKFIDFFDLADKEQKLIACGPDESNIDPYLSAMNNIGEAMKTLVSLPRMVSAEKAIYKLRQQHNLGLVQLSHLYKKWVIDISSEQPLKPILPTSPSPQGQTEIKSPENTGASISVSVPLDLKLPPEEMFHKMGLLATWLRDVSQPETKELKPARTYGSVRGNYLMRLIQPLADAALNDTKQCAAYFARLVEAAAQILDREDKIIQRALGASVNDEEPDLVTSAAWKAASADTITLLVDTGERILKLVSKRNEFTLFFMIFEVLEFWSSSKETLAPKLAKMPSHARALDNLFSAWANAALRVIPDFVDEVRGYSKSGTAPADATVHESTSNTMSFVKKILDYPDTTESLLTTIGEADWGTQGLTPSAIKYVKVSEQNNASNSTAQATQSLSVPVLNAASKSSSSSSLLASLQAESNAACGLLTARFVDMLLHILATGLESKAKQTFKKPLYAVVFLLNNINYIYKALKAHPRSPPAITERIAKSLRTQREQLVELAAKPIAFCLMDTTVIQDGNIKSGLSKTDRASVKEAFRSFNTQLEEILKQLHQCTVPDYELRNTVSTEFKSLICPLFDRFLAKYESKDFTKNPEKYIKYTSASLRTELSALFNS